jgi:hypothetical protein
MYATMMITATLSSCTDKSRLMSDYEVTLVNDNSKRTFAWASNNASAARS